MQLSIIPLPREQWQGEILPIGYTTEEYYNVTLNREKTGFSIRIQKERFAQPVTHTPEEYDFPDKLYQEHWAGACAWGGVENGKLAAAIEIWAEEWSNRLRVTELWVAPHLQKQGLGRALMNVAKEQAQRENRRAVILETQSCNVNAVDFYLHEGFTLIGMDTCCYSNTDLARKEVRLELGWFPPQEQ